MKRKALFAAAAALLCSLLLFGCGRGTVNDPVPDMPGDSALPEAAAEDDTGPALRRDRAIQNDVLDESAAVDDMPDITNGKGDILPPPAAWDYVPPAEDLPRGTRGGIDGPAYPGEIVPPPPAGDSSLEGQIADLVNSRREEEALPPLEADAALKELARRKSSDMAANGYYGHLSPQMGDLEDLLLSKQVSYRYAGENMSYNRREADEVVTGWMNSESHRDNILNPNYTHMGVGFAQSVEGIYYWTLIFTG